MILQFKKLPILVLLLLFILSGCVIPFQPTPTMTPTFTPTITSTPTPLPTNTPVPTNTQLADCDADQTIANLKPKVAYQQSVVIHNKFKGGSFLVVWFVDPTINATPQESEISENDTRAMRDGLLLSQQLNAADGCVSRLFDAINPIVVDKNYNGWFSGRIKTSDLPATTQTDDDELDEIAKSYEISYLRDKATAESGTAPATVCTWTDTKQKIQNHFSPERQNVGFYYVLDDAGVNVWAQWDSPLDFLQLNLPASLLNIAMEIDCLYPTPDRIIFDVVDESGDMQIIGLWNWSDAKNQDIGQIQILYQK